MSIAKWSTTHKDTLGEPLLTPAASEKLERSIEILRAQILREISRRSDDPNRRARASDVDTAVSRIGFFDSSSRTAPHWAIASVVASALAILGQITIATVVMKSSHTNESALVVGVTAGATATATTLLIVQDLRRRTRVLSASRSEFLKAFVRLENRMRRKSQELLGPLAESASLGRIISAIELLQLWTPEDSAAFRRILGTRNAIVHEDGLDISSEGMAEAFSRIARLMSLLDDDDSSGTKRKIREIVATRMALAYEERVVNALRSARLVVSSTQGDIGYDALVGTSDRLKKMVIKYRNSGLLTVKDVTDVQDRLESSVGTVIVTNVEISPYVFEYLGLTQGNRNSQDGIVAVSWRNGNDSATLVRAIVAESAELDVEEQA